MMNKRADFLGDLGDFAPKAGPSAPVSKAAVNELAERHGFPSREPSSAPTDRPRRRARTGREFQVNFRVTRETLDRLYRYADDQRLPLGEVLRLALDALGAK
ncbi:MAG: stability/partitioning determinant [Acidobacteriota bacterium]|nr:stability/partitioning determinant [Acidobacteriota bacterium]